MLQYAPFEPRIVPLVTDVRRTEKNTQDEEHRIMDARIDVRVSKIMEDQIYKKMGARFRPIEERMERLECNVGFILCVMSVMVSLVTVVSTIVLK